MQKFDVIIVGAGILGLATAYHLKRQNQNKRILLIDKLPGAAQGDAAKTGELVRNFFSEDINYTLTDSAIDFYENVVGALKKVRYLWLFSDKEYRTISNVLDKMSRMGVQMRLYEREELSRKLKMNVEVSSDEEAITMGLCDVEKGVLAYKAGILDTDTLTKFYKNGFNHLNGEVLYNTRVNTLILKGVPELGIFGEPFSWQDKKIAGVVTNRGNFYSDKIVLTAGVWNFSLLDPLGIYYDVKPGKRQIFIVKADNEELRRLLTVKGFNDENQFPVVIPPFKAFFIQGRKGENTFWISYRGYLGMESKLEDDPKPHENYFYYGTLPLVAKYFPQFRGSRIYNMWAGLHARMTSKEFCLMELGNLLVVNVGSAYCFGDSIGRIAASVCLDKKRTQLSGGRQIKVDDLKQKIGEKGEVATF